MGLPSSRFQPQLLLIKSASTWNKRFSKFATMKVPKKGPKLDPPGGTTFDFKGSTFWPLLETRFLCKGVQNWTLNRLNPVPSWRSGFKPTQAPSSAELFQCRNASTSHKITSKLAIRAEQGRPQLRLQKSYQFQVLKTNPKEASFPCLSSWWQPFPF